MQYDPDIRAGVAQSAQRIAKGWAVGVSNPGGGEIFRTRPGVSWDPPSVLINEYPFFPGAKTAWV
jgi:hypothetical protein